MTAPTNLTTSLIATTSARFNWQASAESYQVEWREEGSETLAGTASGVEALHYGATGLTPATHYEWRVRATGGDWTAWVAFTTAWTACAERTYLIPANDRTYTIPADDRTYTVGAC